MNKAIFLDRDGVINDTSSFYYVYKTNDFVINPGIVDFLKEVTSRGFLIIVISNQSGISKKVYSKKQVNEVHEFLQLELKKHDIHLENIYYCPHHNEVEKCICRKPDTLMLEKGIARYQIDVRQSFLIGDSDRDIVAGKKVGITSIKVNKNQNLNTILNQIK